MENVGNELVSKFDHESVNLSATGIQAHIQSVIIKEAEALGLLASSLPHNAWQLVYLLAHVQSKIIFSGVGKSGLVSQKIAATCSSMGIPSFFLHPTDGLHGDLGVVQKGDLFVALSKSATGEEFDHILPVLRFSGIKTVLICCKEGSLAEKADLVIQLPFEEEACTFNLAPTSSSTVMMAFGDALAVATSIAKGFTKHDFARYHPAGALGKKLLWTVRHFMHDGSSLPLITPRMSFKDLLLMITKKKLGLGIVVEDDNQLAGIITDGDLRRACEFGPDVFAKQATEIATINPKVIAPETLAYVALELMEEYNITSLVVVEDEKVVGLVHIHDLIKAGIRG